MSHQVQNLTLHGGDDIPLEVTVRDAAGDPVDISAASEIRWAVASAPAGPALVTKTKTGGHITFLTDGTDGVFCWSLGGADTVGLDPGKYYHEAEIALGGVETTVLTGTVTLLDSLLD